MEVTLYKTVSEKVNLSDDTVKDITVRRLQRMLDGGEYLREVKVKNKTITMLKMDDPDHRHGSISEVDVREATELDKAIIYVLQTLRKL